jgi:endonuclease YncB( thermonuclease family)
MKLWTDDETAPFATAWREAKITNVVDGDTYDLAIDLGFDVQVVSRIRLMAEGDLAEGGKPASVDAWETRGAEKPLGEAAKQRVLDLVFADWIAGDSRHPTVRVYSAKGGSRGKYGRWLAVVLVKQADGWRSIGDILLEEGHAEDPGY